MPISPNISGHTRARSRTHATNAHFDVLEVTISPPISGYTRARSLTHATNALFELLRIGISKYISEENTTKNEHNKQIQTLSLNLESCCKIVFIYNICCWLGLNFCFPTLCLCTVFVYVCVFGHETLLLDYFL